MFEDGISFQRERVCDIFDEILPMLEAHHDEVSYPSDILLDVDRASYEKCDGMNVYQVFTARRDDKLIGYAGFFVCPKLQSCQSLQALQDVLYLAPDERKGRTAARLIMFCDEHFKSDGVDVVYHQVMKTRDFGKLLESVGYEFIATVYARRLN